MVEQLDLFTTIIQKRIFVRKVRLSLQKLGYSELIVLWYNISWTDSTVVKDDFVFWHPNSLWTTNPAVFYTTPTATHRVMRAAVLALTGSCLWVCERKCVCACLTVWIGLSVCAAPWRSVSLHTSPKCILKSEEAAVCCGRLKYKQHYKSSLQTSSSLKVWINTSPAHTGQTGHRCATADQPVTETLQLLV